MNISSPIALKCMVPHMASHIYVKNRGGIYLRCNDFQAKSLNLKRGVELIGKIDEELPWPMGSVLEFREHDIQVITHDICLVVEETGTMNGKKTILISEKIPIKNQKGKIIGVFGLSTSVNELQRAQRKLKVTNFDQFDLVSEISESPKKYFTDLGKKSTYIIRDDLFYELSKRQQECTYFLVRGYRYTEIAKKLNVKISTVQTHVEYIKEKLRVVTHSQMIEKMIDLGFASLVPESLSISSYDDV